MTAERNNITYVSRKTLRIGSARQIDYGYRLWSDKIAPYAYALNFKLGLYAAGIRCKSSLKIDLIYKELNAK